MRRFYIALIPLTLTSCIGTNDAEDRVVSQKYIHKYGFELDKKEWVARDRDGKIEQFLANGVRVVKTYQNGDLQGETTYTYPYSATIERSYIYEQDELIQETIHDRRGVPIEQKHYNTEDEKTITFWGYSGAPLRLERYQKGLLTEGTYYNTRNAVESTVKHGEGRRYKRARNGALMAIDDISSGVLEQRTTYHPNGNIHVISRFEDYALSGVQKIHDPSGQLYMTNDWENGAIHGKKIAYRKGQVLQETPYQFGKREGVEKRFDDQGALVAEVEFHEDEKHGPATLYNAGDGVKKAWFYKGKPIQAERFHMLTSKEDVAQD